jgi:fibronectin type 3 domain-containing protein/PKD repeat protein
MPRSSFPGASSGATSYNIYRSANPGGEGNTPLQTGVSGTSYTDTGLTNGTTYYYQVSAVNSGGQSGKSGEASATPQPAAPAAPTNLSATAGVAQVSLTWNASSGATSYNIYRSTTSGGEGSTPFQTGISGTSYTNTGLTNGTTYYYQVSAVNGGGQSGKSGEASATPQPAAPAAPTNLSATAGVAQVSLTWNASSGATSYHIYRSATSGAEGNTPFQTGISGTSYTDTGSTNGTTYYYQVSAVNSTGESVKSGEASATPQAATKPTAIFSNNGPVNEGSPAKVSFSNASDSAAERAAGFHYSYALSPTALATSYGTAVTSSSQNFTFPDNGAYTVYGRIFNKDNGFTDYTTQVKVINVAPTAKLTSNGPGSVGSPMTVFFINPSDPSSADTQAGFHYSIVLGYTLSTNPLATSYAAAGTSSSASFTLNGTGTWGIYGRIFDKDNGFRTYVTYVGVRNAPTADFTAAAGSGPIKEGGAVAVSFSNATDTTSAYIKAGFHYSFALSASGLAMSYAAGGTSTSANFTFNDNGTYTVYGRIFDKGNRFTTYAAKVIVINVPPTATLSNSGPVNEGSPVTVSFTNSSDPSSVDVKAGFHYSFALSQGALAATYAAAGASRSVKFTFNDNGTYTVYGRIFDKDSGYTDYTTQVTVNNVAPTATLSNNGRVNEGSPVTVSFSKASDPSNADRQAGFHCSFALSQGALASTYAAAGAGSSAKFTFNADGTYTVYGRIFDKDNGSTTYTTQVTVNNAAPTVNAGGPYSGAAGAAIRFTGTAGVPDPGDTLTYLWKFGDRSTSNALSPTHTYAAAGTYTVTLTATDQEGASATVSTTVTVRKTG